MFAEQEFAQYQLKERIGRGGMGVVHRAIDLNLRREVAIKVINQALADDHHSRSRFLKEARAAGQLNHPNVVTVFEMGLHEGIPFIAMEFVRGGTLKGLIRKGALSIRRALGIAIAMSEVLEEAHQAGIVHRDIKPTNILLTPEGTPKLTDFGLVKLLAESTMTSGQVGTLAYMAPEQIRGQSVDPRSDIFSLGVVLYEMLTGIRPFLGESEVSVMYSILHDEPDSPQRLREELPWSLQQILGRSLAKDPAGRYDSMAEMHQDLVAARDELEVTETRSAFQSLPTRQNRLLLTGALLGSLACWIVLGSRWWTLPRPQLSWPETVLIGLGSVLAALSGVLLFEGRMRRWRTQRQTSWPARIGAMLLALAISLILVGLTPSEIPPAGPPTVVVGEFVYLTREETASSLPLTIPEYLELLLWETPLTVVDRGRVTKVCERLVQNNPDLGSRNCFEEACRKVGADLLLEGSLMSRDGKVEIRLKALDLRTGEIRLSQALPPMHQEGDLPGTLDWMNTMVVTRLLPEGEAGNGSLGMNGISVNPTALEALARGRRARALGGLDESLGHLRRAIQEDSTCVLAYLELAELTSDPAEARRCLEKATRFTSTTPRRVASRLEAVKAEQFQGLEAALAAYQQHQQDYPRDPLGYRETARLAQELQRYEQALTALEQAEELLPEQCCSLQADRLECLMELGRLDLALELSDRIVLEHPRCATGHLVRSRLLAQRGQPGPAREALTRAEQLEPGCAGLQLPRLFRLLGRWNEARRELKFTLESSADPTVRADARLELAELAWRSGDLSEANQLAGESLDRCSDSARARRLICRIALEEQRPEELERVLREQEDHLYCRACLDELKGQVDSALELLTRAQALRPPTQRADLLEHRSILLRGANRPEEALELLQSGRAVLPHHPVLLEELIRNPELPAEERDQVVQWLGSLRSEADPELAGPIGSG